MSALLQHPAIEAAARPLPCSRWRLMIVEHPVADTSSLATLLQLAELSVLECRSGADALNAAVAFDPDTVLLELALGPGPTGLDVGRQFRAHARLRRVQLLAVTSGPAERHCAAAYCAGFDGFFLKPTDPVELLRLIRSYDGRPGTAR